MRRRFHLALIAAAALLVAAPFCLLVAREYADGRARQEGGRALRFAGQDWGYPSPFLFYPRGRGYLQMSLVFDTLMWKDEGGLMGLVAESWKVSPDRRRYVFRLRPNVRWHDGSRLTARDVAFSYLYLKKHGFSWCDLGVVEDARAVDDRTVEITLDFPCAPFLTDVAGSAPIIPRHVWSEVDDPRRFTAQAAFMGSGPFRLESYSKTHGTYSYAANADYFLGRPRIERLLYVAVGDEFLAMKNCEIDALRLWSRTLDAVSEFQGDPRYKIMRKPGAWVLRVVFNHSHPVFGKRTVRKALALALDLEDVAERLRHGHVVPGSPGFLPPGSPWMDPEAGRYRYDIEQATALIGSAGLEDAAVTLLAAPEYIREAEYVSEQARKIGIAMTVKSLPASTLDAKLREGSFDIAISGHGGIGGDPDVLFRQFCSQTDCRPDGLAAAGPGMMRSYGYSNPELDLLGPAQHREFDRSKRRGMVRRMQEILAEDVPTIALWYPKMYFVYRPSVLDGWFFSPGGVSIGIPTVENKLVYIEREGR